MTLALRADSVSGLAAAAPDAGGWMSPGERVRLAGMAGRPRAAQFIAGRWLARVLLAETFGGSAAAWSLSAAEDTPPVATPPVGLPLVASFAGGMSAQAVFLSLSHSGDHVACAVSDQPVGIDIELPRPRKHLEALVDATTTVGERLAMPALRGDDAARLFAFFQLWTLKEAWIKCHGGNLFQAMLGHAVEALPAQAGQANGLSWRVQDAVLALVSAAPLVSIPDPGTPGTGDVRGWTVRARDPAAP